VAQVGVYLWVADEQMSVGASWTCELLMRSIELSSKRLQTLGKPFPEYMCLITDNTVSSPKLKPSYRLAGVKLKAKPPPFAHPEA
jgi:hypothetical protein